MFRLKLWAIYSLFRDFYVDCFVGILYVTFGLEN